uniref:DUF4255 domain-containing protein n=1 Tax=Marinobacterium profundum TaxID=1714300 RepID=UPI00082B39E5|nr:DUF4255 domain-containing protein [Marinobacterium profundum]
MPQTSSLSIICREVEDFVRNGLNAGGNDVSLSIGAPADLPAAPGHRVNLFFYRFEPGGFEAGLRPGQPWHIRLFCLITSFAIDEDPIASGENDLRFLGHIMQLFRQTPVLQPVALDGEEIRLQVIFSPVTDEQINQVWSTQGDTTYRPSLIYEMALAVITPIEAAIEPPRVAAIGQQALADMSARHARFSGIVERPVFNPVRIDVDNPQWQPALCWLLDDLCAHTLSFDVDSAEFAAFEPRIWLAGVPGEAVQLRWRVWDGSQWSDNGAPVAASPSHAAITPDAIPAPQPGIFPLPIALPFVLAPGQDAAQGLLTASREVAPFAGAAPIRLESNPLLINLYRSNG